MHEESHLPPACFTLVGVFHDVASWVRSGTHWGFHCKQKGHMMEITEHVRLEMHLKLRDVLGEKVADILMEHLPPSGWSDVARKPDIELLASEIRHLAQSVDTRFGHVDVQFSHVEARLRGIVAGLWAMGGIMSASMVAILTQI